MPCEIEILGPIAKLRHRDVSIELRPAEARLLMTLVRHHGCPVSVARVARELWPGTRLDGVKGRLYQTAYRLRDGFVAGGCGRDVVRQGGGRYELRVDARTVDALRFERLADAGAEALTSGMVGWAHELLVSALDLWRQPAYVEQPAERAHATHLAGMASTARVHLCHALIALGRHAEAVDIALHAWTVDELDEELVASAMVALERSGRAEQALRLYRLAFVTLRDRSGIAPGARLHEVQRAVLWRDTSACLPPPVRWVGPFRIGEPVTLLASAWQPSASGPRSWPTDTELALEIVERGGSLVAREAGFVAAFRSREAALAAADAVSGLRSLAGGRPEIEVICDARAVARDGAVCTEHVRAVQQRTRQGAPSQSDGARPPARRRLRDSVGSTRDHRVATGGRSTFSVSTASALLGGATTVGLPDDPLPSAGRRARSSGG